MQERASAGSATISQLSKSSRKEQALKRQIKGQRHRLQIDGSEL